MLNDRQRHDLDNYITGHGGEDQFKFDPAFTPGAVRAGERIAALMRKYLPMLPAKTELTLAEIIDGETGAPEMLEALEAALYEFDANDDNTISLTVADRMRAVIQKGRGL